MTPFEEVFTIAQDLETFLERNYGATGRGLHEKASSVQNQITSETMRKIRFIATIRNKAAHEDRLIAEIEIENVRKAAEEVYRELGIYPYQPPHTTQPTPTYQPPRTTQPTPTYQPPRTTQPTQTYQPTRTTQPTPTYQPPRTTQPTPTYQPTRTTRYFGNQTSGNHSESLWTVLGNLFVGIIATLSYFAGAILAAILFILLLFCGLLSMILNILTGNC